MRGPKNILRTACEFAIECRHDCTVYLGSLTDIAATLYAFGLSSLTSATVSYTHLDVYKRQGKDYGQPLQFVNYR